MSKSKQVLRPGMVLPNSGQLAVVDKNGKKLGREITGIAGKPLPPTQEPGQGYVIVDETKHKK